MTDFTRCSHRPLKIHACAHIDHIKLVSKENIYNTLLPPPLHKKTLVVHGRRIYIINRLRKDYLQVQSVCAILIYVRYIRELGQQAI